MLLTDATAFPPPASESRPMPPTSTTEPTPAPAPSVPAVLTSVAAMTLVSAAAALGAADASVVLRALPALAAPALGALVLTAPALLAVHQFLGLDAPPERIVAALGRSVVAGGSVALGLVPVVLFFAATSTLWPLALAGAVAGPGIAMAAVAILGLRDAETSALVMPPRFALLLLGWAVLSLAIAGRIAVSMAQLVIAGVPS